MNCPTLCWTCTKQLVLACVVGNMPVCRGGSRGDQAPPTPSQTMDTPLSPPYYFERKKGRRRGEEEERRGEEEEEPPLD